MSGNDLQSSIGVGAAAGSGAGPRTAAVVPASVRGDSEIRVGFARAGADTKLTTSFERGSMRVRLPRRNGAAEAVLVNTGGGITGGDRVNMEFAVDADAHVVATSQAAEKIYRTDGPPARIDVRIGLEPGARLDWLPQETILFDGAAAQRSMTVQMSGAATLTLLEIVVLGRIAHGERLTHGGWRDRWRVRRDGQLVLAEDVRIDGAIADIVDRPAIGDGARCVATLVHVDESAEKRIDAVRERLATTRSTAAASAWDGMLVARFASADPGAVRADAVAIATLLTGVPMPRAWTC
jgi:urease accessory protein